MYGKLLILIILINIFFGFSASAQDASNLGLSVSPQIFELDVFPGEIIKEKIILKNLSEVPLPILVKTTDFTAEENSGEMLFDESSQDPSISARKWFDIKNPNFILNAREQEEVNFEIIVPENAEPGGHYSVILFEPQLPSFYFEEGQPKMIPVIGVLFMISVKNLSLEPISFDKPIEIAEFKIPNEERLLNFEKTLASVFDAFTTVSAAEINIVEKTPSSFLLRIKNNDIYHHKLQGKLLIYNAFGKKVGESEIKKTTILPGKIRQFSANVTNEPSEKNKWLPASIYNFLINNTSFGRYRVVLELSEAKTSIELNENFNFWAFPWKIVAAIIVLFVLIVITRKRMIAALRVLLLSRRN